MRFSEFLDPDLDPKLLGKAGFGYVCATLVSFPLTSVLNIASNITNSQ
jgi:hypothetical protein